MARLIVKSPYIKCGTGQSAGGYLKYIAMRERVEIIPDDRPPTQKQTQLIAKLVKDFPDAKELMEYEDYLSHPTKATASALIILALESNWDKLSSMDGYAKYIALRPRAERLGEHGLFGDDDNVDLNRVMDELDHYTGNVWTHIISLHREDAERLGYDHADAWRTLLRTHRNDIAAAMKIPPEDFHWYAAFHDEGNHPHVHMMAWSVNPNQAYLSKDGIRQIKSTLTNQIFRQELLHVYEQKSKSRDELVGEARKAMLELAKAMREMTCIHPEAEQMIWNLSRQLGQVGGKKTYGYLPKPMKKLVDEMLYLARTDASLQLVYSQINLSDVVWSTVLPFESVAFEQGLTLDSEIAPDIQLQADEGRLREVVRILMDNACKYCEPKGKILVYLEQDGDWASLMVSNSCVPSMQQQDLEHLFERFY